MLFDQLLEVSYSGYDVSTNVCHVV
jgi:hypothetical protein